MPTNMIDLFKIIIIVQLFYAFSITAIAYGIPDASKTYVTGFSDITDEINLETVNEDITGSLEQQKNIPIIELGALVFYSGNILLDLLVNFITAIPQMLAMLLSGILMIFAIDSYLVALLQIFASVLISLWYLIGLMQLLTSVRSGRVV